jgi:hypothetical protein
MCFLLPVLPDLHNIIVDGREAAFASSVPPRGRRLSGFSTVGRAQARKKNKRSFRNRIQSNVEFKGE